MAVKITRLFTNIARNTKKASLLGSFLVMVALLLVWNRASAQARCYITGGGDLRVCHDVQDKSVYYQPPTSEVIYNVQVLKDAGKFYTVYHGEPRKYGHYSGDSMKSAWSNSYNYSLPTNKDYRIWHTETDTQSVMYSEKGSNPYRNTSGAGNPIVVSGQTGDPYYYVFFLAVADDDLDRVENEYDYRHYLIQTRTKDFISYDLKVESGDGNGTWRLFNDTNCPISNTPPECRPQLLKDTSGQVIKSHKALAPHEGMSNGSGGYRRGTQGLIGSISKVNGIYYYFYTDYGSDPNDYGFYVYYRTATDLTANGYWSPATRVSGNMVGTGGVRVAKAKGMDRWAVAYSCYGPLAHKQDLCLQYTKNLNVIGEGGISSLTQIVTNNLNPVTNYYLGLYGDTNSYNHTVAQHYWMTDRDGNLATPTEDATRGGEIYWSDFLNGGTNVGVYNMPTMRAGWDISVISPTPTPTPTPTPRKIADVNNDGKVDIFDYNILVGNFNRTGTNQADINNDSKVDIFDYNILVGNFNK